MSYAKHDEKSLLKQAWQRPRSGGRTFLTVTRGRSLQAKISQAVLWEKDGDHSMDSRDRAVDNIFVERLWRSVKYEEVYLHDSQTVDGEEDGLVFDLSTNREL